MPDRHGFLDGTGQAPEGALSDGTYARIAALLPAPTGRGRPRTTDTRAVLEALRHWACTGCSWRRLPPGSPPWETVSGFYRQLTNAGRWPAVRRQLLKAAPAAGGEWDDAERVAADIVPQASAAVRDAQDKSRRAREISAQARLSSAARKKASMEAASRVERIHAEISARLSRTRKDPGAA